MWEKVKLLYFKIISKKYACAIIIIVCSIVSFLYGDAIRNYFTFKKIHWSIVILYIITALALMEITLDSKWIRNQNKIIKYALIVIMIIYCMLLMITGFTLVFGGFIEFALSYIFNITLIALAPRM